MKKILISKDSKLKIDNNRKYIISIGLKFGSDFNSLSYCSSKSGDSFSRNIEDSYVYTLSEITNIKENVEKLVNKIGVALDSCKLEIFEVVKKIYVSENSNTFRTKKYSDIEIPESKELSFTNYSQDIESDYIDIEQYILDQNSFYGIGFNNFKSKVFDVLEKSFENKPLSDISNLTLLFSDSSIKFSVNFKGIKTTYLEGYFQTIYDCVEFNYTVSESHKEMFEDFNYKVKKEKFNDLNLTLRSIIDEFKWTLSGLLIYFPNLNLEVVRS